MEHVGIDVHKRESQICIFTEDGEVIEQRIATSRERFEAMFAKRVRARIVLEASTESEWVARVLEGLGHEVIVADPNFVPMYATRSKKIKTDRRDARALAEACKLEAYRPAHRRSDAQRARQAELLVREKLVRMRTMCIVTVRSLLRQQGVGVPRCTAERFPERVREVELDEGTRATLAPLLSTCDHVSAQIEQCDKRLSATAQEDPVIERLCSAPGVGPVTAIAFAAAVDGAGRFRNAHHLEAYVGLVPRESSSGEGQHRGSITKAGSPMVRWLLVQAALCVMRSPRAEARPLRLWAERIAGRRGNKIARVALARRMAGILYAMMRDETGFRLDRLVRGKEQRPAAA